jgi:hypothetical protein
VRQGAISAVVKRQFSWCLFLVLVGVSAVSLAQTPGEETNALHAGFKQPPAAAKLRCYWWWLNGNTTAETITRDLKAMKAHGYAGAILVDADGSDKQRNTEVPTGPAIGSPRWIALYVHALDVAQKLGLEISLNVTSRWDVGIIGGPTVKPEDAMKLLTFSHSIVVLLCYKYAYRQQGHLGRERARWVAMWRRRVAMDRGLCRSVRTGSASGRVVGGHTGYGKLDVGHLEWPRVA